MGIVHQGNTVRDQDKSHQAPGKQPSMTREETRERPGKHVSLTRETPGKMIREEAR